MPSQCTPDIEEYLKDLAGEVSSHDRLCGGQSSWLQLQRSGFNSRRYQIFWVVGLERGPLSLVMIIEELFQGNGGSSLENRN
jgi:hypothetical protein